MQKFTGGTNFFGKCGILALKKQRALKIVNIYKLKLKISFSSDFMWMKLKPEINFKNLEI